MSTEIFKWLYLGSEQDATSIEIQDTFRHEWELLNVLEDAENTVDKVIPILKQDNKGIWICDWNQIMKATDWIENWRLSHTTLMGNPTKRLLVHCGAGQERSPLVIQYYLVRYKGFTVDDAFEYIKKLRPEIFRCDKRYQW